MTRGVAKTVLACLVFVALVITLIVIRHSQETLPNPLALQEQGLVMLSRPRAVQDFTLTDHTGREFDKNDLRGHWSILFFGFTHCPDICPVTLATLARTMEQIEDQELRSRIKVYLVSVDPERDTLDKLKQYVSYFSPDFTGLTGRHSQIADFASQVGVAFAKVPFDGPDGYTVDHSGQLVVFNPRGHFHSFFKTPHESRQLARFMEALAAHFVG